MRFHVNSVNSCAARVGTLTGFERLPGVTFETPLLLLCTRGGAIPHLTKDVVKMLTEEQHVLSTCLSTTIKMSECIKEIGTSLIEFISMKEYINFLTIHNTLQATKSGFQKLDSVSVWSKNGRWSLSANDYMNIVESFKPDIYVALTDGDTDAQSGIKRVTNSVRRSKNLFEECLNRHINSDVLKSKGLVGAVEGGYNLEARERSIEYLKETPVVGFLINGLHKNGPDVQNIPFEHIKDVVQHTINLLPSEKLRISTGGWNPVTLLDLVESGIDVFDSSYPSIATEQAQALTLMCDSTCCQDAQDKRSISEEKYKDDFTPICTNCECLTCKNHTRAYLSHLHSTKEMLCSVLLMIHNTHTYLELFKNIRSSIKNGSFQQFRNNICAKFTKESMTNSGK